MGSIPTAGAILSSSNGRTPHSESEIRLVYSNIENQRESCRKHYRENKAAYLKRNQLKRAKLQQLLQSLKTEPCMDCGTAYPYYVMDFDHRPGETKLFSPSSGVSRSEKSLRSEIAKCDLVCANCHRERTQSRR